MLMSQKRKMIVAIFVSLLAGISIGWFLPQTSEDSERRDDLLSGLLQRREKVETALTSTDYQTRALYERINETLDRYPKDTRGDLILDVLHHTSAVLSSSLGVNSLVREMYEMDSLDIEEYRRSK